MGSWYKENRLKKDAWHARRNSEIDNNRLMNEKSKMNKIKSLVSEICAQMGKNQAHDFEGVQTYEDIILYLESIKKDLPYKGISEKYIVESKDI
jgi:hypothetical protein